jgi:tetratricopeptide (TPR) repeat protein
MGEPNLDLTENMVNQPGKEILFAHFASNLMKSGHLEQAIRQCEKGLKKFPTYAQAHYILARCYIRKKMNDEARAELERVLRYDPNHVKAIRDLAGLYFSNGFQDLYKEYLLQLFTLDPMNENVIEEVKKLGEYKLWSAISNESVSPPESIESEPDMDSIDDEEEVFVEAENEEIKESETVPIFPDKIDLSQFDNVEDDFTTILHGKLEYSRKGNQNLSEKDPNLMDAAKDSINKQDVEDKLESVTDIDQAMPDLNQTKGSESEIVKNKSNGGKEELDHETGSDIVPTDEDRNQPAATDISHSSAIFADKKLIDEEEADESLNDSDEFPDEEEDKFEQPKIISQTLGEILVSQQKYVEAKAVFEALKEKQPDNKALDLKIEFLDRIIGLEQKGKT